MEGPGIIKISESKDDSSIKSKSKETFKLLRHSCPSIAFMFTIDLKSLDNTSRIPKLIYTKNS